MQGHPALIRPVEVEQARVSPRRESRARRAQSPPHRRPPSFAASQHWYQELAALVLFTLYIVTILLAFSLCMVTMVKSVAKSHKKRL